MEYLIKFLIWLYYSFAGFAFVALGLWLFSLGVWYYYLGSFVVFFLALVTYHKAQKILDDIIKPK